MAPVEAWPHKGAKRKRPALKLLSMIALFFLAVCDGPESESGIGAQPESEWSSAMEIYGEDFGSKIARSYEESEEWWAPPVVPADDAPNVIIFQLDDVGFTQGGTNGASRAAG